MPSKFTNALVRANFRYIQRGIYDDKSFLILFLRNLLLEENNELKNRNLRVNALNEEKPLSRESHVLELIKCNPNINVDELASKLSVSPRTIKSVIAVLTKEKKIERVNGKRFGYWKVN